MSNLSPQQQNRVAREYFGPEGSGECALCPRCGEELEIAPGMVAGFGLQLRIECPGCASVATWIQPQPVREWKTLYLEYFAERYLTQETIRCPYDDCYVTWAEFNDGVVQFNCPYCNRRGRIVVEKGDSHRMNPGPS